MTTPQYQRILSAALLLCCGVLPCDLPWTRVSQASVNPPAPDAGRSSSQPLSRSSGAGSLVLSRDRKLLPEETSLAIPTGRAMVEAALVADGIASLRERERCLSRWQRYCEKAASELSLERSPSQRARQLLVWMHRNVLTASYDARSTTLSAALVEGKYNCVSATGLYVAFCRELALPVHAVQRGSHVRAEWKQQDRTISIETTLATGFDQEKEIADPSRRVLSDRQLVGLIYYNRAQHAFVAEDFASAVGLGIRAVQFDREHSAAHKNLVGAYNNWAIALCQRGEFSAAQEKLHAAKLLAPHSRLLRASHRYLISSKAAPQ